jgi:hypothetical protein
MSDTIEQEARGMGWVPQEEFRGDSARWVDAETFVERGHTVMPILKKNNERLEKSVKDQQAEIARLSELLKNGQESIAELQAVHAEATKAAVEKARRDLTAELKQAKREGDVDREIEIQEGLDELKQQEAKLASQPRQVQQSQSTQAGAEAVHPEFKGWMADNTWYGTDQRKTMRAMGIAQELRSDPSNDALEGRAFFDKVVEVMEERTGARPAGNKVAEPRASGSSSSGGKSFNDLPSDAKAKCDSQGKKLVGPGRAFKDQAAWRSYYANLYFQE